MNYAHTVTVTASFHDAVARTRAALQEQGFGILTEIDVRATFDDKLGAESSQALGDYLILGACNPALAQRALSAEPDMGLLLPCNVVVRRGPDAAATTVQAINPQTMVELSSSADIEGVADEADTRLLASLEVVKAEFTA
ncbi:DUF302 domain-containing protein [Microbacterium sp. KRD172]|uniref:DUF302 domain-containing protein n=1 Tax=Microbacterium sp. KRD172 TaxID=2729727 RepID=UPI0019D121E5|nr:DUF302 domain-containing protein [Microbacterium sp. KRD172]